MMSERKTIKWKHYINYVAIALVLVIFSILAAVGALPQSMAYRLEEIAISIILAVSLSLVVGFLGELSLGHAGFMCVGAYLGGKTAAVLASHLGNGILTLVISLVVGGLCAGLCGFIIGLPALRLKGDYLAITTLAFGEIVRTVFMNQEIFGGALGLDTQKYGKTLYIAALVFAIAISSSVIPTAIFAVTRAIGYPDALEASAEERDTRGLTSMR